MNVFYPHAFGVLLLICVSFVCPAQYMPDTVAAPNGWRYATQGDVDYWNNVSPGDVLLFGQKDPATQIMFIPPNLKNGPINIQGGSKIHIWRGNYGQIRIEVLKAGTGGAFIETNSSAQNPVIITNLGGQVRFGEFGRFKGNGNFNISRFKHVFVTGEYDPLMGTGDENYKGMDGDLTAHGWINRFGIMGDRKYSTFANGTAPGTGLTMRSFLSAKVRGAAVVRGWFTGFSVKSDDNSVGTHTTIDIQKCLSGWQESEGFYVGSTHGNANEVPDNRVVFKNNVVLFAGAESLQLDKLSSGTEIKNNFVYKSACFYQVPFQANFHDHGFQWSFVEGNVYMENNIVYAGSAGPIVNSFAIAAKNSITIQPSEIVLNNNLLGPSRSRFGYIHSSAAADPSGMVTFRIENNVIDTMTVTESNDAYNPPKRFVEWIQLGNKINPFYLRDNIYPPGKPLYGPLDANVVSTSRSTEGSAPPLLLDNNFGFDPQAILAFRGVWLTGEYKKNVTNTGPIAYNLGDIVFMLEEGKTRYYKCIQPHGVVKKPSVEIAYWQQLTWNGKEEPVYTPLLQAGSYYHHRRMGLQFNPVPPRSPMAGGSPVRSSVTWTDKVGVTETAFGDLAKTAPYGLDNGGAASIEVLPAGIDGWVEMAVGQTGKAATHTHQSRVLGLSEANIDATRSTIDYGIQLGNYTPTIEIYESDSYVGYFGYYEDGDVFRIERTGTTIHYKMNGNIMHTSDVSSTTSLLVDVSLIHPGSTIHKPNISFGQTEDHSPPTVAITSPGNDQQFTAPATVNITATASDSDGNVTKVEFYNGTTKLGEDLSSPYAFTWNNVGAGSYTLIAKATDNDGGTSSSSVDIAVTNDAGCAGAGSITHEMWTGIPGSNISSIPQDSEPNTTGTLAIFETPQNVADSYGRRIRGYICPPASGNYVFWISGNDRTELWLSTDENPANKRRIAYTDGYTGVKEWDKFTTQQSSPLALVANQKYYIEALHKEHEGLDHVAVGWQLPGGTLERPIPGIRLSPYGSEAMTAFTTDPMLMESQATTMATADNMMASEGIITESELHIYPNPATDKITLDLGLAHPGFVTIAISDQDGKSFYESSWMNESQFIDLDLNTMNMDPGLYLIKVKHDGLPLKMFRFVKD